MQYGLRTAEGRGTAAPDRETALAWAKYGHNGIGGAGTWPVAVNSTGWAYIDTRKDTK